MTTVVRIPFLCVNGVELSFVKGTIVGVNGGELKKEKKKTLSSDTEKKKNYSRAHWLSIQYLLYMLPLDVIKF